MKNNIAAIILTFNEEIHFERCIKNVLKITSNIIVVDSYSTDDTLKILKKYKIKFYQNKFSHNALKFAKEKFNINFVYKKFDEIIHSIF